MDIITRFYGDKSAQFPVDDIYVLNSQCVPLERKENQPKYSQFMEKRKKKNSKNSKNHPVSRIYWPFAGGPQTSHLFRSLTPVLFTKYFGIAF